MELSRAPIVPVLCMSLGPHGRPAPLRVGVANGHERACAKTKRADLPVLKPSRQKAATCARALVSNILACQLVMQCVGDSLGFQSVVSNIFPLQWDVC